MMVAALRLTALLLQLPVGRLSNIQGRRCTLFWPNFSGLVISVVIVRFCGLLHSWSMTAVPLIVGYPINTSHSIAASHINDQIGAEQMLSVSSGLIAVNGLGNFGFVSGYQVMRFCGPGGLYILVASGPLPGTLYGAFVLYLINVKPARRIEEQRTVLPATVPPSSYITAEAMDEMDH